MVFSKRIVILLVVVLITVDTAKSLNYRSYAFNIDPDATIFLVPEPATLLLVGLGAMLLRAC